MAAYRDWIKKRNDRGHVETCCKREHVNLSDMIEDLSQDNRYLGKDNIPPYPENVLFRVSKVCHVTDESGVRGIFDCGGFQIPPEGRFLWWSLSPTKNDIAVAERKFLNESFPDFQSYESFLEMFTTSPAFRSESRYGNFRFTFPLQKLLSLYGRQFCDRTAPVLRVLDTKIYKSEIMYTVLVHPKHIMDYNQYPRLPRSYNRRVVCGYLPGKMSWRCQAPSEHHGYRLIVDRENFTLYASELRGEEYYVWDHVAVAFYMEPDWTLEVDQKRLYNSVSVCEVAEKNLLKEPNHALSTQKANEILDEIAEEYGLGYGSNY